MRWKISHLHFFGLRRNPPHLLSSKTPNNRRGILLISAGAIEGHFERKTPSGGQQGGLILARQCPDSPGTCNPEKNWPTRSSNISITHPILLICARRTTTCSLE